MQSLSVSMRCPKCSTNLSLAKVVLTASEEVTCPCCNSRLRATGVRKVQIILVAVFCLFYSFGSWMTFVLSLTFLVGVSVILANMLVELRAVGSPEKAS